MIHISRSKKNGQFYVTVKSSQNGNKLSSTETVKSKAGAWKNIKGQMTVWSSGFVYVQDNTVVPAKVWSVYAIGDKEVSEKKPEKPPTVK